MAHESTSHEHSIGYGNYVLVWMTLMSLTVLTVAAAGIDLGDYTLLVAMAIASVKSALVINIFMHIKFDQPIFKAFLGLCGIILFSVFILTAFDILYR